MTCEELRKWLSADLDGEARAWERLTVSRHLAVCDDCHRARDAASALREGLAAAAWRASGDDPRDEAILRLLREEQICGARSTVPAGKWARARSRLSAHGALPLQPALAAMALTFVLTWGLLQWAELRPSAGLVASPRNAFAVAARRPDPDLVDKWLSGPPTLSALARLEWPGPPKPVPLTQRGAVERRRKWVG